ncbi:MAG: shikimate kinase [Clostridia bacterium]|nr:shikimate kinase [Clostridia bacterium]
MNIVLTGMPASGKTSVAKELEKLGKTVCDTDAEIVNRHGSISSIFKNHGEEYFRNLETAEVKRLSQKHGVVIATGGGCIMRQENVKLLRASGKIVYLRTGLETLYNRAKGNTSRPLLSGDTHEKLKKLYDERTPVYERNADIIIDTDGLKPEEIARKITELIQ